MHPYIYIFINRFYNFQHSIAQVTRILVLRIAKLYNHEIQKPKIKFNRLCIQNKIAEPYLENTLIFVLLHINSL